MSGTARRITGAELNRILEVAGPFLRVGLVVSALENAFLVASYDLAMPNWTEKILFLLTFTAVQGLLWMLGGALVGAILGLAPALWRPNTADRTLVSRLLPPLLAVVVAGYGLFWAMAVAPQIRRETVMTLVAAVAALALGGVIAFLLGRSSRGAHTGSRERGLGLISTALVVVVFVSLAGQLVTRASVPEPGGATLPGARRVPGARLERGTNVLLIVLDTLRADHLSASGYERATSPFTDALAASGVRFSSAIAQATRTSPNMASLLTGVTTFSHGIIRSRSILDDDLLTWGEMFSAAGYRNIAFVANPNVGNEFRFTQGFDEVVELFLEEGQSHAGAVYGRAVERLEQGVDEPFFMWLHPIDPHSPYDPPAPYDTVFRGDALHESLADTHLEFTDSARDGGIHPGARLGDLTSWGEFVARYDGEIRYADAELEKLVAHLERLGLRDNTLIIFTSDHGESLGEHGYFFAHGSYAYEATAHVPLIFSHPSLPSGRVVESVVRTVDILPSVLGLLGLPVPSVIEGESLLPLLEEGATDGETIAPICAGSNEYTIVAARDARHKLILSPRIWSRFDVAVEFKLDLWPGAVADSRYRRRAYRTELYDLVADPAETVNLVGQGLPVEARLREQLLEWFDVARRSSKAVRLNLEELDARTRERLRSLGYIQ